MQLGSTFAGKLYPRFVVQFEATCLLVKARAPQGRPMIQRCTSPRYGILQHQLLHELLSPCYLYCQARVKMRLMEHQAGVLAAGCEMLGEHVPQHAS